MNDSIYQWRLYSIFSRTPITLNNVTAGYKRYIRFDKTVTAIESIINLRIQRLLLSTKFRQRLRPSGGQFFVGRVAGIESWCNWTTKRASAWIPRECPLLFRNLVRCCLRYREIKRGCKKLSNKIFRKSVMKLFKILRFSELEPSFL